MTAQRIGFWLGPALFALTLVLSPPADMPGPAWNAAGLTAWMATWWMTQAIPLSATALLPFITVPFFGGGTARDVASDYYSPIIFLLLGGAFLALAIERTGLHKRLACFILDRIGGRGGSFGLLLGFMVAAAILSNIISNTSTTLIMMPMVLAVLAGGSAAGKDSPASSSGREAQPQAEPVGQTEGLSGALPMGLAFAASIGGLGTIIGSPTNAIGVALLRDISGVDITFARWAIYGVPIVAIGIPLAAYVVARVQRISDDTFDIAAARRAIDRHGAWSQAERRLVPVIALTFLAWMLRGFIAPYLPEGSLTDGTIAIAASLALLILPDGTGRRLLEWREANRAPWDVLLLFGGGLALAGAMTRTGLADWLGAALLPLADLPVILVAMALVAMVILITEFASNVATASGIMPVVAALAVALGGEGNADIIVLLALPVALAASWGFILPAGTGPNAIAWSTGRVALPRLIRAGLALDIAGIFLIVGVVFMVSSVTA
ncbi:SLC13 family permease [Aurantiacibacter aquimixticola]|uniref:DASS family sodium-coupled anion symporter n=1 Tax=Aurantiacibacter aquimixticola TaxID=1958945 RepID=A0A419RW46_9SPHN|nr:DASS family sodium-coupled anion symporter [Aurantiacibacter aquimixticola]RJY09987.1 DASS family sodium-coupled anion symporter [Aurantiacibacter aquimixticola]